ncbi:MAG TPA: NAD-dependent epimerase/dehydratase family protein [Myxococcaceae bacterium]|nr:NAD-dependent epimerase/dehydratase family protein [Myxococcaceae bacterium]
MSPTPPTSPDGTVAPPGNGAGAGARSAPLRVVVAGATGFVGRALIERLRTRYEVIGLTRGTPPASTDSPGQPGLRWRHCDLFSLLDAERALEGAQVAVYLIHSMMPSARLTQGSFADMDLIVADNFRRAAERQGLSQIVYLGGLIPEAAELSPHLTSRLEVERTLGAGTVPLTALRAGLVLGPNGSSFRILENLVARLPVMLLPRWARTPTQPIALPDLLALLEACLGNPETYGRVCEVGGPDVLTYRELIAATARAQGVKRLLVNVPAFSPRLSNLWVSVVTGTPLQLVAPLVESLRHPMVAKDPWLQRRLGRPGQGVAESLAGSVSARHGGKRAPEPKRKRGPRPGRPVGPVRSVQRLPLPKGWRAGQVARAYARFLPDFLSPLLRVTVDAENGFHFYLRGLGRPLLELTWSADRSTDDRQLFYVTGGLLARRVEGGRARLEFREVLGGEAVLAGVHDFTPRLPWLVYNLSQSLVHLVVMAGFGRWLAKQDRAGVAPPEP